MNWIKQNFDIWDAINTGALLTFLVFFAYLCKAAR